MLFVSQSFAYNVMACPSMTDSAAMNMHDMDNQGLSQSATQDMQMGMDCCDDDCSCPIGACASTALTNSIVNRFITRNTPSFSYLAFFVSDAFLPSLHKPPITV
jgi:hypothetical protein